MKFVRLFGRGLLIMLISFALSVGIGLATLQATLLNKNETKSWLIKSGIYNNLVDTLVQPQGGAQGSAEEIIDQATLKKALMETFPPSYTQQQIEGVLDNTYAWLEGKSQTLSFSINIPEKRQEFAKNLGIALESKVAQLPTCSSRFDESTSCVPPGMSKSDFAQQLANRAQEGTTVLEKPITEQSTGQRPQPNLLPQIYQAAPTIIIGAIVTLLLAATGYVFLSDSRLRGLIIISRRITLGTIVIFALGVLVWYLGSSMQLSTTLAPSDQQQAQILGKIIDPLLQQVLPAIGTWMMLITGSVVTVSGATWLTAYLFARKQEQRSPPLPPSQPTQQVPPAQPLA